ncbi:hypothetical protein V2O64_07605 [Verrucomicrobiaceae bacterium 227]
MILSTRFLACVIPLFLVSCKGDKEGHACCGGETEAKAEVTWIDLDPAKWKPLNFGGEGAAAWTDGVLHLDAGAELTGMLFEGDLPEIPYELELEARKVTGSDFFCGLTFPVRSRDECVSLIVGGWGGGTVGISSVDDQDASSNDTTTYHNFEEGHWYAIRVRVEEEGIAVTIDDEQVVDLKIAGKKLGLRQGVIELCAPLGFAAWQTESEARGLRWRSLVD